MEEAHAQRQRVRAAPSHAEDGRGPRPARHPVTRARVGQWAHLTLRTVGSRLALGVSTRLASPQRDAGCAHRPASGAHADVRGPRQPLPPAATAPPAQGARWPPRGGRGGHLPESSRQSWRLVTVNFWSRRAG